MGEPCYEWIAYIKLSVYMTRLIWGVLKPLLSLPPLYPSPQQVSQEKAQTETKWMEEKKRRIKTEKRLRLAEDSLKRLDRALRDSGVHIDIQIETDVRNLKGRCGSRLIRLIGELGMPALKPLW
jgi:hypothetical protein